MSKRWREDAGWIKYLGRLWPFTAHEQPKQGWAKRVVARCRCAHPICNVIRQDRTAWHVGHIVEYNTTIIHAVCTASRGEGSGKAGTLAVLMKTIEGAGHGDDRSSA